VSDDKTETMKSCSECGKVYENDLHKCPRCGHAGFYYIYILDPDLWEDSLTEDIDFTVTLRFLSGN